MAPRIFPVLRLAPLLLCLLCPVLAQAEPLVLNTDGAPPHSRPDGTGFEDRIVAEAFRRIGLAVRLVMLPSERSLRNADAGVDDGVYVRVAGLESRYPGLVMVPEPVSSFVFTAFTRDRSLRVAGWTDLGPLSVAIVTGWKIVEDNTRGVRALTSVRDEEAVLTLLAQGRVDVAVAGLHAGRDIVRRLGLKGVQALSPPLAVRPMYIYLNRRHAALVPRLDEALRRMRADGSLERLTRTGLGGEAP